MSDPAPHDYGCQCQTCCAMAAAIVAKDLNGEYFFTDDELLQLALETAYEQPRN